MSKTNKPTKLTKPVPGTIGANHGRLGDTLRNLAQNNKPKPNPKHPTKQT